MNGGKYKMGKGKISDPNVTFVARDKDWVAVSNGKLSGTWAYMTGRLKIWIADAHRDDGKRFVMHADEKLTAFLELESALRARGELS